MYAIRSYYDRQQVEALLDGGADLLLVETIFDTLNAKAALFAIEEVKEERKIDVPVMVSGTITDASGRTVITSYSIHYTKLYEFSLFLTVGIHSRQSFFKRIIKVMQKLVFRQFTLQNKKVQDKIILSYQLFGQKLGTAPVVVVNHALTGNSQVIGENGWWNSLIGEGKTIV